MKYRTHRSKCIWQFGGQIRASAGSILANCWIGPTVQSIHVKEKWMREGNVLIFANLSGNALTLMCDRSLEEVWMNSLLHFFITPNACFAEGDAAWDCADTWSHRHTFWECPVVKPSWTELHKWFVVLIRTSLPMQFFIFVLGISDSLVRQTDEYIFGIMLNAGKSALTMAYTL